jgi:hypothetical protein
MGDTPPTTRRYKFPIARAVWRFTKKRWRRWRERHQLPFNFWLHMVGIPLAMTGVVLWFYEDWTWGTAAFVTGYLLQFIGHWAEGNDVGELVPFKRLLGLPYVTVAPRWQAVAK